MAIDFGTKRVGLAVTDPNQIIATALTTVHPDKTIEFLKSYMNTEPIACFVVGEPRQMDNSPSEITAQIEQFIKKPEMINSVPTRNLEMFAIIFMNFDFFRNNFLICKLIY